MSDVFVSYARPSERQARQIADTLRGLGCVVCSRLLGEDGNAVADAGPDHARELVRWDDDDQ